MSDMTLGQTVRALREQRRREWSEAEASDTKLQAAKSAIRRQPPKEIAAELDDAGIDWLGPAI